MKAYSIVALAVAAIALLGAAYWLGYSHDKPPVIEHVTANEYTIIDSIPGKVQVIRAVDRATNTIIQTEYAEMDTVLHSPSGRSQVELGIGYNEATNLFRLRANFSETSQIMPEPKRKAIGFVGGVGVGFADSLKLHDAELSAGVEFAERYSVALFGRTDKTYGIRFGVRL